jgi:hypothetical protein
MRFCLVFAIFLAGCTTMPQCAEPIGTLVLKAGQETPNCGWLKAHGVDLIESQDAYEITTEELCE